MNGQRGLWVERRRLLRAIGVPVSVVLLAASAPAQVAGPGSEPAKDASVQPPPGRGATPAAPPTTPPPDAEKKPAVNPEEPPSLDDLLGTGGGKAEKKGAGDATKKDLDRKLSAQRAAEQFKQAVDLMGDVAGRLQKSADTGLGTQRVQEDILRKLDMMIAAAKKQQSQSQSDPSDPDEKKKQQQQQPSQQQASTPQKGQGENPGNLPPGQTGPRPGLSGAGAAWGSLPARVRDALLQGSADNYSDAWRNLTIQYYKKLAEEAGK